VETFTELLKLSGADRFVPCTFDSAPSLLEFGGVGFGKVISRIALHVNDAKLNVGRGE
jgi:hypothetical protein